MNDMKIKSSFEPLGASLKLPKNTGEPKGTSFSESLAQSLGEVNKMQHDADRAIEDLVTGRSKSLHDTMITLSKAELAFKLTMQVKTKVLEAYKEVMNTAM
jgi:flagellar hook-basal body complex protein FliE